MFLLACLDTFAFLCVLCASLCPLRPKNLAHDGLYKYLVSNCVGFLGRRGHEEARRTQRIT